MTESTRPEPVAKPHSFGRYRVTKTLGSGAMGEVYEAVDDVLGREVAIKTLRGASGLAARFIDERFRNEARAIAQLAHPGVVQVFDIDLSADPPYLVMERVSGPALSGRLDHGPLPIEELVALGIQIARALAAAHAVNVIHRDVKPSNILGAGPGVWKLADFGVAHIPDSSLTMTGQFVGSPAYAAPEALIKGSSTAAGDVYGLGATLYEAATGSWPRVEASGALLAPVPPLRERAPHVPDHIAAAIDRAVSLEADRRPTASEVADLLAGTSTQPHAAPAMGMAYGASGVALAASATPPHGLTTTSGSTAHGAGSSTAYGTAVSAAATTSSPALGVASGRRGPLRWQPWAAAGGIILAIVLVLALRGGDNARPVMPRAIPGVETEPPDQIDVVAPPHMDRRMAKDWYKLVDDLQRNDFATARDRLDDWEDRYGETDETRQLRAQLDRFPPEMFERGRGHKKHKD